MIMCHSNSIGPFYFEFHQHKLSACNFKAHLKNFIVVWMLWLQLDHQSLVISIPIFTPRVRLVEKIEKWEDRRYFSFPYLCLVGWWESGGMKFFLFGWAEKWKDRNFFFYVLFSIVYLTQCNRMWQHN